MCSRLAAPPSTTGKRWWNSSRPVSRHRPPAPLKAQTPSSRAQTARFTAAPLTHGLLTRYHDDLRRAWCLGSLAPVLTTASTDTCGFRSALKAGSAATIQVSRLTSCGTGAGSRTGGRRRVQRPVEPRPRPECRGSHGIDDQRGSSDEQRQVCADAELERRQRRNNRPHDRHDTDEARRPARRAATAAAASSPG